mgnify:FL=1
MAFDELMMEGFQLLGFGMGIVFGFLIILVFAMKAMSWLALALGGQPQALPAATPDTPMSSADTDGELVAVISAAIARYRKIRR